MEIRVLKYFLTVAKEGSITKAAKSLHLTQPTLSRQIQELEKELNQKLLVRSNHNIKLTNEGLILSKRAEEILDMVEKTQKELSSINKNISGEIYIGSGETEVIKYIAEIIKEINVEYPDISFNMHNGNLEDVTEKLDKGLIDFGIIMQPADSSKYNKISLPKKDSWGIVMRKDSCLANKKSISLTDLEKVPLILSKKVFRKISANDEIFQWFNDKKKNLKVVMTHNLFYNAAIMAEQGIGYLLTLNNLANTSKNSNLCFIPLEPEIETGWDVIWKKNQIFSPAANIFLERLNKYKNIWEK